MADFSTWQRDTLEQFAMEATDKLVANREAIAELLEALTTIVTAWEEGRAFSDKMNEIGNARAAIAKHTTKHDLSPKEQ